MRKFCFFESLWRLEIWPLVAGFIFQTFATVSWFRLKKVFCPRIEAKIETEKKMLRINLLKFAHASSDQNVSEIFRSNVFWKFHNLVRAKLPRRRNRQRTKNYSSWKFPTMFIRRIFPYEKFSDRRKFEIDSRRPFLFFAHTKRSRELKE